MSAQPSQIFVRPELRFQLASSGIQWKFESIVNGPNRTDWAIWFNAEDGFVSTEPSMTGLGIRVNGYFFTIPWHQVLLMKNVQA